MLQRASELDGFFGKTWTTENGYEIGAYSILDGKPEEKRPLGRPRSRRKNDIRIDLREVCWQVVERTDLAQDGDQWQALVNTIMYLSVTKKAGNSLTS
jgi:hypothetical protein